MRSDLIYISFRVGFVLLLTAGFLIFLAYPSVQKYIKGGIMVEVTITQTIVYCLLTDFIFELLVFDILFFVIFPYLLGLSSVQKYIKGGIIVEVITINTENKYFSLVYLVLVSMFLIFAGFVWLVFVFFVYICFISPHQVAIRPEAIGGRPQLQFLDAPAITICAKVLNKNFPVNTAIKLSNQRKQSVNTVKTPLKSLMTLFQDSTGNYWKDNQPSNGFDHLQKNCNGSETVKDVLDCINNKTFSLDESIKGFLSCHL